MSNRLSGSNRPRRSASRSVKTQSGQELKVNRSLGDKWSSIKEAKAYRKAQRMRGLPKSRIKRLAWRLNPKRLYHYWFSRDGGIMALKVVGIGILVLFVLTLGVFAYFRKDLPNLKDISGSNLGGSISYYDRTGKTLLFQDYNAVKRVPVQSEEISQYLKDATVAVEDRDFYKHRGFDLRGISRAAFNDIVKHNEGTQGGSTITQQLVKLTRDWTQQRTFTRKVKELILAVELERTYTKDEILTGYLNAAPYGGVDYGAQAAAADYFHVSAKKLTLAQSAMLAAIPKSPSYYSKYSPDFDEVAFKHRYDYVLDSMVQTGKLKPDEAEAAKKVNILKQVHKQQAKYAGIKSPYFVLSARNEVLKRCAETNGGSCAANVGGWRVTTTLDMSLQKIAEKVTKDNVPNINTYGADESAIVAQDVKTGQMVALVGGTDFNNEDHGKINYAQWNISPGSSFKPYDYAALIDNNKNVGAGSVLYDVQGALPGYPCTNKALGIKAGGNCLQDYDFRYPGALTLRYALGGSRNVPAVKAMLSVGTDKTIKMANEMMGVDGAYKCYNPGVDVNTATTKDEAPCYGSSAIGDGAYVHLDHHVNGLATFARMGKSIPATYILEIQNAANKTIYKWEQPKDGDKGVKQVIKPDTAYIVNNMASDPRASYLPYGYYKWHEYNGWHNAIKTGTTNNGFDGLMTAWNTKYAVASWVGYHTRNQELRSSMEVLTTPLTKGFMTAALDRVKDAKNEDKNWKEPDGIKHTNGYVVRNHVGIGSSEPSPSTEVFPSWYEPNNSSGRSETIDKVSGKKATNCTPESAKQFLGGSSAPNTFSVDKFYPPGGGSAGTATASGSDDVHSCSDEKPNITLTVSGNTVTGTATAGTYPFTSSKYPQFPGKITLSVNGNVIKTCGASGSLASCSANYSGGGGSSRVTATVTDSVLYSDSASKSVNFSGANGGPKNVTARRQGGSVKVSWSGGSGPFNIDYQNGSMSCSTSNSCFIIPASDAPIGSLVTVEDNSGKTSSATVTN